MWISNSFASTKSRRLRAWPTSARPSRPQLRIIETLEGRQMLSANISLSVIGTTVLEGTDGTRSAAVVVSLANPNGKPATVSYATANGSALAGSDYTAVSGKLTFGHGES